MDGLRNGRARIGHRSKGNRQLRGFEPTLNGRAIFPFFFKQLIVNSLKSSNSSISIYSKSVYRRGLHTHLIRSIANRFSSPKSLTSARIVAQRSEPCPGG